MKACKRIQVTFTTEESWEIPIRQGRVSSASSPIVIRLDDDFVPTEEEALSPAEWMAALLARCRLPA